MARSSSGLGRRPLKAEITGSTPVRATKIINMAGGYYIWEISAIIYPLILLLKLQFLFV